MNTYNNIKNYFSPSEEKHYSNFIVEQTKRLENPRLSLEEKQLIIERIEKVKKKSQLIEKNYSSNQLSCMVLINTAGIVAGPIGVGIATAITHKKRAPLQVRDIYKAKKCGESRVKNKKKRDKNYKKGPSATTEGIIATVWSLVSPVGYIFKEVIGFGMTLSGLLTKN